MAKKKVTLSGLDLECAALRQDIRDLRDELKALREYVDDQIAEVKNNGFDDRNDEA